MKKQLFLLTAITSILIYSCKKDSGNLPSPGNNSASLVKTETGASIYTYKYDASGRSTEITYPTGKTTYEYQGNKVTKKYFNTNGVMTSSYIYDLDANGLVSKVSKVGDPNYQENWFYNSDKQIIKQINQYNGVSDVRDYFYSNGNEDSVRVTYNGQFSHTVRFSYFTDKLNLLNYANYGVGFFGKKSKNLIKTEQYFYADGSTNDEQQSSYEVDGNGKVTKGTYKSGQNIEIIYYSY